MKNRVKDRNALNELEPWEFQYYAFNCTEEDLKMALNLVGNSPEEFRNELVK